MIAIATHITGPAIIVLVLVIIIVLLLCCLEICHAQIRALDAHVEALDSQLELSQMKIREMENDARRERCNPS